MVVFVVFSTIESLQSFRKTLKKSKISVLWIKVYFYLLLLFCDSSLGCIPIIFFLFFSVLLSEHVLLSYGLSIRVFCLILMLDDTVLLDFCDSFTVFRTFWLYLDLMFLDFYSPILSPFIIFTFEKSLYS